MAPEQKRVSESNTYVQMAKPSVPVYDVMLPDDPEAGVTAISFVLNPANQYPFLVLSAEQHITQLVLSKELMQQVVTGAALIPDQLIFRHGDGKPHYIRFSAETIAAIRDRFDASGKQGYITDAHATPLVGNRVVKSWLVEDPENDESAALGLKVPKGTWMLNIHIQDAGYWNDLILPGKRTGLSIEAGGLKLNLSAEEPDLTKYDETNLAITKATLKPQKKSILAELRALFLGYDQLKDGQDIEIDDSTGEVFAVDADGNRGEALPDGTYTLESGDELIVKDGKKSDAAADAATELAEAVPAAEAPAEAKPDFAAQISEMQAQLDELKAKLAESEQAKTEMAATVAELETKLSAAPAAKPMKLAAITTETEMTPAQRRMAQLRSLRA